MPPKQLAGKKIGKASLRKRGSLCRPVVSRPPCVRLPLEYWAAKEREQIWSSVVDTKIDQILPYLFVDCKQALTKWVTYRANADSYGSVFDNPGDELGFMEIDKALTPIICSGKFSRPGGTLNPKKGKIAVRTLLKDRPFVLTFVWYDNGRCAGLASTSHMVVCVHTTAFMVIFDPLIGSAAKPITPFVRPPCMHCMLDVSTLQ